jgi:hypothetical protein
MSKLESGYTPCNYVRFSFLNLTRCVVIKPSQRLFATESKVIYIYESFTVYVFEKKRFLKWLFYLFSNEITPRGSGRIFNG